MDFYLTNLNDILCFVFKYMNASQYLLGNFSGEGNIQGEFQCTSELSQEPLVLIVTFRFLFLLPFAFSEKQ